LSSYLELPRQPMPRRCSRQLKRNCFDDVSERISSRTSSTGNIFCEVFATYTARSLTQMENKIITRRDFLGVAAGTAVAATFGAGILGEAKAEPTARVVLIRNAEVVGSDGKVRGEILQTMLDEAVSSLLGTKDSPEAWQQLIKSSDIVGIKSNSWSRMPTPKELEAAIKRRLLDVGVAEKNMDID